MQRRDFIRGFVVPTAAGAVGIAASSRPAQAQTGSPPYFPQTPAEQAASPPVAPVSPQYPEGDIFRYFTQKQIDDVSHSVGSEPVSDALNAAFSVPGITVTLRAGKYLVDKNLRVGQCGEVVGPGWSSTVLQAGPNVTTLMVLNDGVVVHSLVNQRMRGFKLLGYAGANAVGIHAGVNLGSNVHLQDIWIENFTGSSSAVGLWIDNFVTLLFQNCYIVKNNLNVLIGSAASGCPTTIHFIGGAIRESVTHGVFISSGNSIRFSGTVIESNYGSAITAIAGPYPANASADATGRTPGGTIRDLLIENDCWFEGNWRLYSTSKLIPDNFVYDVVLDGSMAGLSNMTAVLRDVHFSHGTVDVGRKSLHVKSALANLSNMRCEYGFPYEIVVEGGANTYVQLVSDSVDRMARFVGNLDRATVIYPKYASLIDQGNGTSALPT